MVSVGLPFAVTLGWALGETTKVAPPAAATPDGIGGIGTAPERDKPVSRVDYPERGSGARSASSTAPVTVRPSTTDPSSSPASTGPAESPKTEPSTPAPTTIPSESAPSAEPSGIDVARVIRNP